MRPIYIIYLCFLLLPFLIFPKTVFCEYNLATGEEENLLISSEKEIAMGESVAKRVEEKMKLDENYTNQERVKIIGHKLALVSDRTDLIYHFKVLKEDSENAFALPGGYIYIFSGLLEKLETDDEIAAVLAHEMGHVCARHSIKRLQKSLGYEILRILAMRGAQDNYSRGRINEAVGHLMLSYSREDEFEADKLSVKYLKKAGYDPEATVKLLERLLEWQMKGPIRSKRYWYTHPYLASRRAAVRKEITGEISFDDYMNITDEEGYIISGS